MNPEGDNWSRSESGDITLERKRFKSMKLEANVFQQATNVQPPLDPPPPLPTAPPIGTRPEPQVRVMYRKKLRWWNCLCCCCLWCSFKMPPTKDYNTKQTYARSYTNNGVTMSAKVYHPATNLMPLTPPQSPTGMAPTFGAGKTNTSTFGRQNSNGKYS